MSKWFPSGRIRTSLDSLMRRAGLLGRHKFQPSKMVLLQNKISSSPHTFNNRSWKKNKKKVMWIISITSAHTYHHVLVNLKWLAVFVGSFQVYGMAWSQPEWSVEPGFPPFLRRRRWTRPFHWVRWRRKTSHGFHLDFTMNSDATKIPILRLDCFLNQVPWLFQLFRIMWTERWLFEILPFAWWESEFRVYS